MEATSSGTYKCFIAVPLPSRRQMIINFFAVAIAVAVLSIASSLGCRLIVRAPAVSERDSSCKGTTAPTYSRLYPLLLYLIQTFFVLAAHMVHSMSLLRYPLQ